MNRRAAALAGVAADISAGDLDGTLERVRSALRGLRYGTVTLQVQDGVVVLIERVEKVRLAQGHRSA